VCCVSRRRTSHCCVTATTEPDGSCQEVQSSDPLLIRLETFVYTALDSTRFAFAYLAWSHVVSAYSAVLWSSFYFILKKERGVGED